MMPNLVAGFDMDGVIAHGNDLMAAGLSKMVGRTISWRDWHSYDFFKTYGVTSEEFMAMCIDVKMLELADPEPGIKDSFRRLADHGIDGAIITARGYHPDGERLTRDWMAAHGIDARHLTLVGMDQSKVDAIAAIPGMIGYVDDYDAHLDRSRDAGLRPKLFMRDQPWNQHRTDYERVHTVDQYVDKVLELSMTYAVDKMNQRDMALHYYLDNKQEFEGKFSEQERTLIDHQIGKFELTLGDLHEMLKPAAQDSEKRPAARPR